MVYPAAFQIALWLYFLFAVEKLAFVSLNTIATVVILLDQSQLYPFVIILC
jgi:hypothetical protein